MNGLDRIFTFIFEDEHWLRKTFAVFLCCIFFWLVFPIFILQGYLIEISRRAIAEPEAKGLPAWDRLGEKFISGVKIFFVDIVYVLIPIAIVCMTIFGSLWPEIQKLQHQQEEHVITSLHTVVPATLHDSDDEEFDFKSFGETFDRHALRKLITSLVGMYVFIGAYSIALMLLMPIVYARFAVRSSVRDALNIVAVFRFFICNWKNVLLVFALQIGLGFLACFGIIAFIIGIFFTMVYAKFASYHLYGLLYRESVTEELA